MALSEIEACSGGGGKAPDESAAYLGIAYVNNYIYAINYDDASSYKCGSVSGSAITYSMTLCDYTFEADGGSLTVTAKSNVKVRVATKQNVGSSVEEYTISNGSSQTFSRTATEASGNQVGVLVETFAS